MSKKDTVSSIEGKGLDGYTLQVSNVIPGRFAEETNFELYLKARNGEISENPVARCKYFSGRGEFYRPWLEIYYYDRLKFKSSEIDLSDGELDENLFKHLSDLLPHGSHIMVVYVNHEETHRGLDLGIPAPATPIGYLLLRAGFTWFKNWYFAEGFWEGDVKLQGEKPLNDKKRKEHLLKIREELTEFLRKEKEKGKIFLDAGKRAGDLLREIAEGQI